MYYLSKYHAILEQSKYSIKAVELNVMEQLFIAMIYHFNN